MHGLMDRWMDGWVMGVWKDNGWIDRWWMEDGWMHAWMDGCWVGGRINEKDGKMDKQEDGQTRGQTDE